MADHQLVLLRRQYRQLFEPDFISWPPLALLRNDDVQAWLYRHLFDSTRNDFLPPDQYQLCVLNVLVQRIAKATGNSSAVHRRLTSHLEHLKSIQEDSTTRSSQHIEAYITFTCLHARDSTSDPEIANDQDPTITLLERRSLVVGSKITGFRTWEGCMHLATYLLTSRGQQHIRGKRVLELGAGTGFLSILCAKFLGARHVLSTDGDGDVIEALRENVDLNSAGDGESADAEHDCRLPVDARVLWWGEGLGGMWVQEEFQREPFDVVLGADITYDKDAVVLLAFTLNELLKLQPQLEVIIAGVVRRADSFELFLSECNRFGFTTTEVRFEAKPMREQKALFYAAAMPLKILSICGPAVDSAL
ncbi:putative methyltransferase-domain-containing protein [Microdochium trichocladiopsis]|uniref:Methyltransferase-domain-containing protein n=1 Tax=Microdochium trichocladiopsis TaxID=1682393 RepID=A0A9P9BQD5_9PEZI|nr:putative methyltransferase-domain-containing protein [Microdochium trichocladiopsis]KAH7034768.1 putative methyltransferase-domain-containing protein [Microdochium trichocladiopsis]